MQICAFLGFMQMFLVIEEQSPVWFHAGQSLQPVHAKESLTYRQTLHSGAFLWPLPFRILGTGVTRLIKSTCEDLLGICRRNHTRHGLLYDRQRQLSIFKVAGEKVLLLIPPQTLGESKYFDMALATYTNQATYETNGTIRYLDRLELYKTEKPYEATFLPVNVSHPGARRSNISLTAWPVVVRDFSHERHNFNTDIQGFELAKLPTSLSSASLKDLGEIQSRYYNEAETFLTGKFDAKKVLIFDTAVSQETR